MKVSKNSQQNNSETVTNEYDKEIPKERYISSEERQIPPKIVQRQLQMKMIEKCLKKYLREDICLQKKDRQLLIISDQL